MAVPDVDGIDPDVMAVIRAYCGWHIAPAITQTIVIDGPGPGIVYLPSLYVTEVTGVVSNGVTIEDPEWSQAGMIRGSWSERFRGIEVTFTHGYPEDEIPDALLAASRRLSAAGLRKGVKQYRIGQVSVDLRDDSAPLRSQSDSTGDTYVDSILSEFRIGVRP